jgi:hypothetical protein
MSYEVDNWRQKKCKGFRIPIAEIRSIPGVETVEEGGKFSIKDDDVHSDDANCEMVHIEGTIDGDAVVVKDFYIGGEGSGHFYNDWLDKILEASTGEYEAVVIWEGGDSIQRLNVKDGTVTVKDVDL